MKLCKLIGIDVVDSHLRMVISMEFCTLHY